MKRGTSTLVLVVLGLALGAYIYFVESKRPAPSAAANEKPKLFDVKPDAITELKLTSSSGESTTVKKDGTTWKVTEPIQADADQAELSSLTSSLSTLELQRTVDENPSDLSAFGLQTPKASVGFKAGDAQDFQYVQFGAKTPTGSDMYAKLASENKVFLVSGFLETTFDRKTFDLRDKSVLKFDRNGVTGIEVASGGQLVQLAKADDAWRMAKPWQSRGDYGTVEGLVGRLNTGQMKTLVADNPKDLKTYGLDKPAISVTVSAGSSQAALSIGGSAPDNQHYARDSSRPLVFTVDQTFVDDLKKAPADYRPKDLFDFRTFTGNRVEVTRAGSAIVFERVKGEGENASEVWKQTQPALDVEASTIEDFLSKASNLRADSFVETVPGNAQEVATIAAKFSDNKKEEQVKLFRAGSDVFATRQGDTGAAKLAGTGLDDALKALDEVKPKAPEPTTTEGEKK